MMVGSPAVVPRPKPLRFELAMVVLVACTILLPGLGGYSLVDPWETHYGEVARNMLVDNDYVYTQWPGTNLEDQANEGFRSKPVLQFWMMAAGLKSVGVGAHGGYSGEMVHDARTMIGIRYPFVLSALAGLVLMWVMLARLISRRVAWLALLVVGSCPFFCLVSRQAIPDMPLVACTMGALALFTLAMEDGDRPITRWSWRRGRIQLDARHVVLGVFGGFVVVQLVYDTVYFATIGDWAFRGNLPNPAIWLPLLGIIGLGGMFRDGFAMMRAPFVLLGAPIALALREPIPPDARLGIYAAWERHAIDRYIIRGLAYPVLGKWGPTQAVADRALAMAPIATMRQVYLMACYALLGVSILAKGPPGVAVVGGVGVFYVILLGKWRALYNGDFEIKRGLLFASVIFLPWHLAMWMKAGPAFINEYLFTHILNRATTGVDNSPGTFEYYSSQIGHGMWLWAALLPAAIASGFAQAKIATREGRVRFIIALWAIVGVAFFSLVQTKFHHYILPAIPALCILVALFLDDLLAKRERLHPVFAAIAIAIVFLVCRDLMFEPERWIEMFVFRYDRPWPAGEPWAIDTSDAFLGLAIFSVIAIAIAATRFVRTGVALIGVAGLAICIFALHVYMPPAGTHWGMRDAIKTYYDQRTVYGEQIVYFDAHQLHSDWGDPTRGRISFDTVVPESLQIGQPMTVKIQLRKPDDERVTVDQFTLVGAASKIGDHTVEITLAPGERDKLAPSLKLAGTGAYGRHRALYTVDADRLIAWQLYWRGEQFWSGGEIWDYLPEMRTSFPPTNNTEFTKYLADRQRMPLGRRYFLVTDAGRITSVKSMLPTQRGKDTFVVLDTTSNKFSLAAFDQ